MADHANQLDCLIIGGGPAGLTAAIYLARFRRNVAVFDGGKSRAGSIPKTRNYPGFAAGISGSDLLGALRCQIEEYGIEIHNAEIEKLDQRRSGFVAYAAGREVSARYVVLATGLVDTSPPLTGLKEAIEKGAVRYCPICDGYEASDQRIGVLGSIDDACGKALFLRGYSKDVTLLSLKSSARGDATCSELSAAGIKIPPSSVQSIECDVESVIVVMEDGERESFDVIYPVLGCNVRSELATRLGARHNDVGCLEVDAHQRTTVTGIYAIGDVVSDLHQITVGTGHAAIAATHVHNSLPRALR